VVVGHDFRSYSLSIKQALTLGLISAGCQVHDIGLALSPVAYFAQFALDTPAVAMVTASHNENGWTGVKMGAQRPLTFGPDEMLRLKEIALSGQGQARDGGSYRRVANMRETYLAAVTKGKRLTRPIRVVAACGNGTAGAFAPEALRRIGADVVVMDGQLDWNFPKYNPNPEDMHMLHAMGEAVRSSGAEIALGFDGDGDRCGVVDDEGHEIFADKVGVLLARDLSSRIKNAKFVVDVKSTGIYEIDPVLRANNVVTDYWKTGHSYIKRRTSELGAVAGFEKSGHYFFNPPIGRGYDDSIVAAIAVLEMLDRAGKRISTLVADLPKTWSTPTMAPFCPDERKYDVVDMVTRNYMRMFERGETILGLKIARVVTVNGIRVTLEDGTWGLVRASSNKPSLVVVCESPVSEAQMRAMFVDVDTRLSAFPEIGEYDQKI
jgi:phosphomannomutase / phosphoglucomutase